MLTIRGLCTERRSKVPYSIRKSGNKYLTVKKDTGEVVGTHDSREKAIKQIVAIRIHEHGKW